MNFKVLNLALTRRNLYIDAMRFAMAVLLLLAAESQARIYAPGTRVRTMMTQWVTGEYEAAKVSGRIYLPQNFVGIVESSTERVTVATYRIKTLLEDPEGICGPDELAEITLSVNEEHLMTDFKNPELAELRTLLLSLDPTTDVFHRNRDIEIIPFHGPGMAAHRAFLISACGIPHPIAVSDLDTEKFAKEVRLRRDDLAPHLSADYPVLSEIKILLQKHSFGDEKAYAIFLRDLPKLVKKKDPKALDFLRARSLLKNLILTSEIDRPSLFLKRTLREAFQSVVLRQLILEEAAYWFVKARTDHSTPACEKLVETFNLLEHVNDDYDTVGIERANSILFLYEVFHGAYFKNHYCTGVIAKWTGYFNSSLPYGLPAVVNPSIISQTVVTKTLFRVPISQKKLHEDEWGANVPRIGRVIIKGKPGFDRYVWKTLEPEHQGAITKSEDLIQIWAQRSTSGKVR
jgi:hypothetical protein